MKKSCFSLIILKLLLIQVFNAEANLPSAPDIPITHCYHWLREASDKVLTHKYNHAKNNKNELTFYNSNGVAGAGLYCAKTLLGSYTYGDRVVKITFVQDLVIESTDKKKYCGGIESSNLPDNLCKDKPADVLIFNTTSDWYVIRNPDAVFKWTANGKDLLNDFDQLKANGLYATAATHFDQTKTRIEAEIKAFGLPANGIEYINGRSRLGIEKIIENEKLEKTYPVITLLEMLMTPNKLDPSLKRSKIDEYVKILMTTPSYRMGDLASVVKNQQFVEAAEKFLAKGLADKNLNAKLVIGMYLDNAIDLKKEEIVKLLSNYKKLNIEIDPVVYSKKDDRYQLVRKAILSNLQEKDSEIYKKFALLISGQNMENMVLEVNESILQSMINFLLADETNVTGKTLAKVLYLYSHITTPVNILKLVSEKKVSVIEFFELLKENKFKGSDPMLSYVLIEQALNAKLLGKDVASKLIAQVDSLPIPLNNVPSYQYLDDLGYGSLDIPNFFVHSKYFVKLVARAILEQKKATNIYRLVLTGISGYFNARSEAKFWRGKGKQPQESKNMATDEESRKELQHQMKIEAEKTFSELASYFINKKLFEYSYIALSNYFHYSKLNSAKDSSLLLVETSDDDNSKIDVVAPAPNHQRIQRDKANSKGSRSNDSSLDVKKITLPIDDMLLYMTKNCRLSGPNSNVNTDKLCGVILEVLSKSYDQLVLYKILKLQDNFSTFMIGVMLGHIVELTGMNKARMEIFDRAHSERAIWNNYYGVLDDQDLSEGKTPDSNRKKLGIKTDFCGFSNYLSKVDGGKYSLSATKLSNLVTCK